MAKERPIGVYDSGVGGLTVVRWLQQVLPMEQIIYFGDTARVPYGGRSSDEIVEFSRQILAFFLGKGVKFVIAACNTSSALALPLLVAEAPIPMMGVIYPGAKAAVTGVKGQRIGVIGTKATVESHAYGHALRDINPDIDVGEIACPELVPLVEAGEWEGERVDSLLVGYLSPLIKERIDTLILGCTHYPFLLPSIERILGPEVRVVDPGEATAQVAASRLRELGLLAKQRQGDDSFYVSGDPLGFRNTAFGLGYDYLVQAVDISRYA
ncbi:MAG: glutamate racemase [Firmicutes bacterium]|nr:glutamate racemase [Bacillota bacterium]